MMTTFLILTLLLLMAALTWVGLRTGTSADLFLGGRKTGPLALMLTFLATQLGGGTIVGGMEAAASCGWVALCYALGTVIGFFFLAAGFGPWLRRQEVTTVAEIFEKIYRAPKLRRAAALLSVVSLFLILVAQAVAMRKMLAAFGITSEWLLLLTWGLVVLYTAFGGFNAVVLTDAIQVILILGALLLVMIEVLFTQGIPTPPISSDSIPWIQWMAMPLLYMFVEQDMGQRCCAAATPRAVSYSAAGAGTLLACVAFVPVLLGMLGATSGLEPLSAIAAICSPVTAFGFYIAVLMAILSTADSLLNSITSNIVQDLGGQRWKQSSRIAVTILVGIGSAGIALLANSVIAVLVTSYELLVCVLVVPVLGAAILRQPSRRAAEAAMVLGGGTYAIASLLDLPLPAAVLALPLALVGYACGILFKAPYRMEVTG